MTSIPLPILDHDRRAGTRMGRRRAIVLVVVHLLVIAHVVHWWKTGSTLTPLEPSEAGYAIRSGAINAGAIFLALLIVSTVILGRFFCGWACHVVAYQDLARWILVKIGLRPQPVRSRLLALVPLFGVYWLYGRPLVARLADAPARRGELSLHLLTDDFWSTFPGPTFTVLTFIVCGFLAILFLGAKGFCTYGCPYGALFGIADRAAPGRIRVNEDCDRTGACTTTCSSNVDVASEVARFGMVVDPGCMKCMDCVTVCPNGALSFGFGPVRPRGAAPPAPRTRTSRSRARARSQDSRRRFDFTWPEEIAMVALFAGTFAVYYNLYRMVPFLLALGICTILAYVLLTAARLVYTPEVTLARVPLRRDRRLTTSGRIAALGAAGLVAFTVHGGVIQWHTRAAVAAFDDARTLRARRTDEAAPDAALDHALDATQRHLDVCARWSPVTPRGFGRMTGEIRRRRGDHAGAVAAFDAEIARGSRNRNVPLYRGLALWADGRTDDARGSIDRAFDGPRPPRNRYLLLDEEMGMLRPRSAADRDAAATLRLDALRRGIAQYPADGEIAMRLCRLLVRGPSPALRDPAEALRVAEATARAGDRGHADLLAMLAWLYGNEERFADAVDAATDSITAARASGRDDIVADMTAALAFYREQAAGR